MQNATYENLEAFDLKHYAIQCKRVSWKPYADRFIDLRT